MECFIWITFHERVKKKAGIGNWGEDKLTKMTQGMYTGKKVANEKTERELTSWEFKYISAENFLSA